MFALLGDITFQVIGSPETYNDSRRYDYAEHRVIQDRPRLQWLADDLTRIRLELLLHRSFTNPATSLVVMLEAASTHLALPLIFGNGDFRGYFVITQIDTTSRQMSGSGDLFGVSVRLSLCESPLDFDPGAPAIPPFVPIAITALAGSAAFGATASLTNGISALAVTASPSGPTSAILLPNDIPTSVIVRSAL